MARPKAIIKRRQLGARVEISLINEIKHLSIDSGFPFNILIEEALKDLLGKYKKKLPKK